jgi:hypothetical protein
LVNGQLVPLVNGQLVQLVNSQLVQIVNGQLVQLVNSAAIGGTNSNTAVITDLSDTARGGWLGAMFGINMITGMDVGTQKLIPGVFINNNFDVTYALGNVTIQPNACVITHNTLNNFSSTPKPNTDASMWMNVEVKVSGQLTAPGDYLVFTGATVTFNNVTSTPTVSNLPIPAGKIVADPSVTSPKTYYDVTNKNWVTRVPVGFSSTSDIFISGVIINSSTGFVAGKGANSVLKGIFLSNKSYSDQWSYAMAGYRPQFSYQTIADTGKVASMNGTYRAGTPIPVISTLVGGGSSGGGNNYTGSSSSYDNFTACTGGSSVTQSSSVRNTMTAELTVADAKESLTVYPNPTSREVQINIVPHYSDKISLSVLNASGMVLKQIGWGTVEKNKSFSTRLDLGQFSGGVYFIKYQNGAETTVKKLLIVR